MAHVFLLLLGALVVAAVAYGVTWVITGRDSGLDPEEPDGRGVPLPTDRPLFEADVQAVRFDSALRGYRMEQVDAAVRRAAYDIGYKDELITVLEAEVAALRGNRLDEAEALRAAREGTTTGPGRPTSSVDLRAETETAANSPDGTATGGKATDADATEADSPTPAVSGR